MSQNFVHTRPMWLNFVRAAGCTVIAIVSITVLVAAILALYDWIV